MHPKVHANKKEECSMFEAKIYIEHCMFWGVTPFQFDEKWPKNLK